MYKFIYIFAPSNNKRRQKNGFPTLVAAYTYRNSCGLLDRWSETAYKKPIKNPLKWWHH